MYSCIQFKKKDYRTKIIEHNSYIFNYIFRLIKDTTTQRTSREENKGDRNTRDSDYPEKNIRDSVEFDTCINGSV